MSKLEDAQSWYEMLDTAYLYMPDTAAPWVSHTLESLLNEACSIIAREVNPETMSDIRAYDGDPHPRTDDRLADELLGCLINKAHDDEQDPGLEWFSYPAQIGYQKVLDAPVETPQGLVAWLRKTHREKFDGSPCAGCKKPLAYDERHLIGDQRGELYFHAICAQRDLESRGRQ